MQEVNVAEPGTEPSPAGPIPEDMRLLHTDMADKKGDHPFQLFCLIASGYLLTDSAAWHGHGRGLAAIVPLAFKFQGFKT